MTKIIIVRHGNSVANVEGIYAGLTETPLSEVGKMQAKLVCGYLYKNFKIDKIYSSPLSRAVDTVKLLAEKLNEKIIIENNMREMFGGEWEGKPMKNLPLLYPEDFSVWQNNVGFARCTGGESYPEVQIRAMNAIQSIAKNSKDKTVVVATHGGLIRAIECAVKNIPLERMNETDYVSNASISIVNYIDEKFVADKFNIVDYLGGLQTEMPKGI